MSAIVRESSRTDLERSEVCVVCDAPAVDERPCPRVPRIAIPLCSSCLARNHRAEQLGARTMTLWALFAPAWAIAVLVLGLAREQWASAALATAGLVVLWIAHARDRRRPRPWPAMVLEFDEESVTFVVHPERSGTGDPFRGSAQRTEEPQPAPALEPPACASSLAGLKIIGSVGLTLVLIVLLAPYLFPLVRLDNPTPRPCSVIVDGQRYDLAGKEKLTTAMHVGNHTFEVLLEGRPSETLEFEVSAGMRHLLAVPEPRCYIVQSSFESQPFSTSTLVTELRRPERWISHQGDIGRAGCPEPTGFGPR